VKATAILMNYKREPNIHPIIRALHAQTADLHIVLINNGSSYTPDDGTDIPDEVYQMPHNLGPFARFLVAYAYEGWLYFQDDDVMPGDDNFVDDLLTLAAERPRAITGTYARDIRKTAPFYRHKDKQKTGGTNFVKTVCMTMHRKTLGRVRFPVGNVGRNDDIHVNLEVGRGEPVHYMDFDLRQRLKLLSQLDTGLSSESMHYIEREAYCEWWLRKEGLC